MQELRVEIKTPNLIISSPDNKVERLGSNLITAEDVKEINSNLTQPEYQSILREVVRGDMGLTSCEELVRYKCGWGAPGEFNRKYFENSCK